MGIVSAHRVDWQRHEGAPVSCAIAIVALRISDTLLLYAVVSIGGGVVARADHLP